jgi:hypothetical protein
MTRAATKPDMLPECLSIFAQHILCAPLRLRLHDIAITDSSLCAHGSFCTQDETILNSPAKVKKFLLDKGIEYDPGTPGYVLRGKAKARMKRERDSALTPAAKRALIDNIGALHVTDVLEMIKRIETNGEEFDKHYRMMFTFEEMPTEFVRDKHFANGCKGRVVDNKCLKCSVQNITPDLIGIEYGFFVIMAQIKDDSTTMKVYCGDKAGFTMFGLPANEFRQLDENDRDDRIEKIMSVPMSAQIMIVHKPEKNNTFLCIYDVVTVDY